MIWRLRPRVADRHETLVAYPVNLSHEKSLSNSGTFNNWVSARLYLVVASQAALRFRYPCN